MTRRTLEGAAVEREKALEMALSQIEKQFGKGAVMRMGDEAQVNVASIPTGALSLDLALGIGGLPRGRVVEIYGPESSGKTSIALHAVAEAQKEGGIAAFIDAEHALDPKYAAALGVDVEALLVSQPDTGEQALEITDMLVRSGAVDIIVIDSVAALTPRAELEGEMGDSHVGLQARLMSQALRKLSGTLSKSRTCAVFINQIREKIGVMFGCFAWSTRVTLADGTQEKIGKIVSQRLPVEVLSYDPKLGRIVPRKVTNWFDNGRTEDFLTVVVARGGGNGRAQFSCTPNHLVRTPGGWREARELQPGDHVLQAVTHRLSSRQWEVLLGGLLGDSALSPIRSGHGARLRWGHGARQAEYADWKASLFANIGSSRSTNTKGTVFHDLAPLPELAELRDAVYFEGRKVISYDYLKRLTPLSLAIWYMDDASFALRSEGARRRRSRRRAAGIGRARRRRSRRRGAGNSKGMQVRTRGGTGRAEICVEALEPTSRVRLLEHLRDEFGIAPKLVERGDNAIMRFPTSETAKLHRLVAPYVHPSMDYKLLPSERGKFGVEPSFTAPREELMPMPVLEVRDKPLPKDRIPHRYDIEVEGTHNYFVDGVMVHNSPETQPGGRALKFYSSVRLDVRRIESLKDGTDFVGNRVRVKVVKNKCVAAGTRVFDPTTGLTHKIEDIVDDDQGTHVVAADKQGALHVRPITSRFDQGEQEVIGLRLQGGAELWVTPDHRILTEEGWREAGALTPGDRVARPRVFAGFGNSQPVSADPALAKHRGSRALYLSEEDTQAVHNYLRERGVTARAAASLVGLSDNHAQGGLRAVLGAVRLRRDRIARLADALDSDFLRDILADELYYERVHRILPARRARTFDIEVEGLHNFVAEDVVVHNCAAPFRQAEFDILFGEGISREGSILDIGVDAGIVRKAGAWYTYEGEQLGQGRENARNFLRENDDVAAEIYKRVTEHFGLVPSEKTEQVGEGGDVFN